MKLTLITMLGALSLGTMAAGQDATTLDRSPLENTGNMSFSLVDGRWTAAGAPPNAEALLLLGTPGTRDASSLVLPVVFDGTGSVTLDAFATKSDATARFAFRAAHGVVFSERFALAQGQQWGAGSTAHATAGPLFPTPQFTGVVPSAAAPALPSVDIADVDGDGIADVVASNASCQCVAVLTGRGDGTFEPSVTWKSGSPGAIDVAIADFDADGVVDLAVAHNGGGTVNVLLGEGQGSFARPVSYVVPQGPIHVVAHDLDRDGAIDLVVGHDGVEGITTLRGVGDGTFALGPTVGGLPARGLMLADVDLDGEIDAVGANANTVFAFLGAGDGSFQPGVAITTVPQLQTFLVEDMDGDGAVDVLTSATFVLFGQIVLARNDGAGAFGAGELVVDDPDLARMAVVDVDADGSLDVVYTARGQGTRYVTLRNARPGVFEKFGRTYGPLARDITVGDIDADGDPDLVVSVDGLADVAVVLTRDDGQLDGALPWTGTAETYGIALVDVFGDHAPELVTVNSETDELLVYPNAGGGAFARPRRVGISAPTLPAATEPTILVTGDLDGDGRVDFVTGNATNTSVILAGSDGPLAVLDTGKPAALALGDIDSDGILDLVVARFGATAITLRGVGDGTFGAPVDVPASPSGFDLRLGDVDGDRHLDLIIAEFAGSLLSVQRGDGAGGFAPPTSVSTGSGGLRRIDAGDLNGDGRTDVLLGGQWNSVRVFHGAADGTLVLATTLVASTVDGPSFNDGVPIIADVDGDGRRDAVVGGALFLSLPDGSLTSPQQHAISVLAVGDVDTDGTPDLVGRQVILLGKHDR